MVSTGASDQRAFGRRKHVPAGDVERRDRTARTPGVPRADSGRCRASRAADARRARRPARPRSARLDRAVTFPVTAAAIIRTQGGGGHAVGGGAMKVRERAGRRPGCAATNCAPEHEGAAARRDPGDGGRPGGAAGAEPADGQRRRACGQSGSASEQTSSQILPIGAQGRKSSIVARC